MFSASSFAKASFSVNAFKMAQDTDTARSGYWRLFYYNMQAESEAKRHNVVEAAKPQAKVAARKVVRSLPAAVPAKVRIEPTPVMPVALMPFVLKPIHQPTEVEVWTPPVLPKPIYHKSNVLEIDPVTQFLSIISAEFRSWLNPYSQKLAEWEDVEASNDEHDIELLLLAA